jgi:2,4-didehydro-3-deoxy-L-rhamnonate hydrolase
LVASIQLASASRWDKISNTDQQTRSVRGQPVEAPQLERGGQWTKGKSHDTFCPIGPWLVTKDEVADPQRLQLWCDVGEVRRQDSNTADMIFTVAECVSYISEFMTLLPGDVITTGTPQGVGLGLKPPQYLRAGDIVRLGIEGLGEQLQNIKPHRAR